MRAQRHEAISMRQYQSNYSDDNEDDSDLKDMRAIGEKVSDDRQAWVPFLCARVILIMREIIMTVSQKERMR